MPTICRCARSWPNWRCEPRISPRPTHWAQQALYIDVQDVETHRMLAEALVGRKDYPAAVAEYEMAVQVGAKNPQPATGAGRRLPASRQKAIARENCIKAILAEDATFPGAAELLKQVEQVRNREQASIRIT